MKVISIDDNSNNLLMVEALSAKIELNVTSFTNPLEALNYTKENNYDIIVIDYMMPEMTGIDFIHKFREFDDTTPIIMITAVADDPKVQIKALEAGATDFLAKPINAAIFQARITNLLKLKKSLKLLSTRADLLQLEVEKATKDISNREMEALMTLGKTSEYRDPETNAHVMRVSNYSKMIAKNYGMSEKMQDIIYYASQLHDIGKIGIPDNVLLKPDKLTDDEWNIMKTHSELGADILRQSKSQYLKAGSVIAITHHEKFDGTGYPYGLEGEEIPLFGRIVSIADVFDALCSKRPYKKIWSFEDALQYIKDKSGQQFDPQCVKCFVQDESEIKNIFNQYKDE